MIFERDPNDRRRMDGQTQRNRDAEVARLRRQGVPFRAIAERLGMSLGAVQKSVRRSQKLIGAMAGGEPGDVLAACDDELRAADVTCVADIDRLSPLERYRLRHMPGEFGDAERARPWTDLQILARLLALPLAALGLLLPVLPTGARPWPRSVAEHAVSAYAASGL